METSLQRLRLPAAITAVVGLLSLLAVLAAHLALTDIWHGTETDLRLEWRIVQIAVAVILVFQASVFILLARVIRLVRQT